MTSIEPTPVPPMGDDYPGAEPFPMVAMQISAKRAGRNRGRYAKVWLHPDGSVTWAPHDLVKKRPWWKRSK